MKILCVHQGYELYGSDRSFLQCVGGLRAQFPGARITAVIPKRGPLAARLDGVCDTVLTRPLWVLRKKGLARQLAFAPIALPVRIIDAWRSIARHDLTYINSVVVIDYLIAARLSRRLSVAHIREIPTGRAARVFRALLKFSRCPVVFNSASTADVFALPPGQMGRVLHNGVPGPAVAEPPPSRQDTLNILSIGRFNSWKGQDVLVEAIGLLSPDNRRRVKVRLVGDVFEDQQHFVTDLKDRVRALGLEETIAFFGFAADPEAHYRWADVVVVPSKKPEPFGRVAIEGMAYARPVIGTRHGGLTEIIADGETGRLILPNDPKALADAIVDLIENPEAIAAMARAGRAAYESRFSEAVMLRNLHAILTDFMTARATT